MATSTVNQTNEFAQIILDQQAAAASLSNTIERQNEVFLNACRGIVNEALHVAKELKKLDGEKAEARAAKATSDANEKVAALQQPTQSPTKSSNKKEALKMEKSNSTASHEGIAKGFISSTNQSMENAVIAQQQLTVTMQAATTMMIATILNTESSTAR